MVTKENKLRKWKKGTRLFITYEDFEKRIHKYYKRCRVVWWKPCEVYSGERPVDWWNRCPQDENGDKVCETYGYKPRYGKVSKIDCQQIKGLHTQEEMDHLREEGILVERRW